MITSTPRILIVALGLGMVAACGFGGRLRAACEAKCGGLTWFHSTPHAQGSGKTYRVKHAQPTKCKRIWWINPKEGNFASNEPLSGYEYEEALTATCDTICYANGGLWGQLTCSDFEPMGDAMELACWKQCLQNNPNP